MLVTAFRSRFVFEVLPGGFFLRLPYLGQVCFTRDPDNALIALSSEKAGGETLGYWGRLRWVVSPWGVLEATGEV